MKKTTFELPDDLMKRVKLRALRDGKKLKETVADLLKSGLAAAPSPRPVPGARHLPKTIMTTDPETGLPVIKCPPDAPAWKMTGQEMSDFIKQLEMEADLERLS